MSHTAPPTTRSSRAHLKQQSHNPVYSRFGAIATHNIIVKNEQFAWPIDNSQRPLLHQYKDHANSNDSASCSCQPGEAVARIGNVPSDYDKSALKEAIQDLLDDYSNQSLMDFDLSGCLNGVVRIIQESKIYLPAKVAMLIKVLFMLEGTAHQLSPHFSVAELIQPYAKRAMKSRYSPRKILNRLRANAEDWEHLITILPETPPIFCVISSEVSSMFICSIGDLNPS